MSPLARIQTVLAKPFMPAVFFFSGVTYDTVTLTRIDRLQDNLLLLVYLLLLGVLIVLTGRIGIEAPPDRVGLGSRVTVLDLETNDTDTYMVVLAEMMDIDAGHISLASPLGRALSNGRVGDEISLRLPTATRKLRILELVTVHQTVADGGER